MERQVDNIDEPGRDKRDFPAAVEQKPDLPAWRRFLSHDSGPFAQFVKYGAIGVMSTCVQTGIFYLLAATCLKCLTADDWAVKLLRLPSVEFTGEEAWYASRGTLAAAATAIGFFVANIFCWLMNRAFVFRPGKFAWYKEFALFFGAAAGAMALATGISWVLINWVGLQTSAAVVIEVVVSFLVNFFIRKFFIFKG